MTQPIDPAELAAQLMVLIERRQSGATVTEAEGFNCLPAGERKAAADTALADFIGANWPTILALAARNAALEAALRVIQTNAMNEGMGAHDFRYTTERRARAALEGTPR